MDEDPPRGGRVLKRSSSSFWDQLKQWSVHLSELFEDSGGHADGAFPAILPIQALHCFAMIGSKESYGQMTLNMQKLRIIDCIENFYCQLCAAAQARAESAIWSLAWTASFQQDPTPYFSKEATQQARRGSQTSFQIMLIFSVNTGLRSGPAT